MINFINFILLLISKLRKDRDKFIFERKIYFKLVSLGNTRELLLSRFKDS